MTTVPSASVLVRTWFGDDSAWESLIHEVQTPSDDGFLANVVVLNDSEFADLSAEMLRAKQTVGRSCPSWPTARPSAAPSTPVLAVWVRPGPDDDRTDHGPFRVIPATLGSRENNINLANMDWADFTNSVGADGVFRGF